MPRSPLPRLPTLILLALLLTTFYFLHSSLSSTPTTLPTTHISNRPPPAVIPPAIINPPSEGGGGEPIKSPAEKAVEKATEKERPVVEVPDEVKEKPVVPGAAPGAAAGVAGVGGPPRGDAAIDADLKDGVVSPKVDGPPAHKGAPHSDPVTAKPDTKKPRIAILTLQTKETTYTHLSLRDKTAYARKHNYDLIVDFELDPSEDNRVVWHKLVMIERELKSGKYDWLWWIDFDTLITNRGIKLESLIDEGLAKAEKEGKDVKGVDMILTTDCFPLNAGSMLLHTSPALLPFLSKVRQCGAENSSKSEQDCVRDLVTGNGPEKDRAVFLPQHKMNAFPEEIKCYGRDSRAWEEGDFVVHFAGAWAHVKGEDPYGGLMRKYEGFVVGK